MAKIKNIIGQKFGRLTVTKYVGLNKHRAIWECLCECGNYTTVSGCDLRKGHTKSCGCYRRELSHNPKRIIHGHYGERIYRIYTGMLMRCYWDSDKYKNTIYKDRNITVCDEWRNDFKAFYNWAMANGYADNLSIDRIDNDKGYSPENCRWATAYIQTHNRRKGYKRDGKIKRLRTK